MTTSTHQDAASRLANRRSLRRAAGGAQALRARSVPQKFRAFGTLGAFGALAILMSGCVVRPLPPYNPQPLPDPNGTQIRRVPESTLPNRQPPAVSTPVPDRDARSEKNLVALAADLSGAEVQPPSATAGRGDFAAVYDRSTRLLRWKSSVSGLQGEVTGISFNGPADVDQNAPPVMEWASAAGRASYEGRATLSATQASGLLAGTWYVNVRTRAFPQGELRGQVTIR